MFIQYLIALNVVFTLTLGDDGVGERICWFSSPRATSSDVPSVQVSADGAGGGGGDDLDYDTSLIDGSQETCVKNTNYCYSLWKEEPGVNGSDVSIVVIAQGCWEASGKQECERSNCLSERRPPKALNNTNFCCCKGDLCNTNMTNSYTDAISTQYVPTTVPSYTEQSYIMLILVLVCCVLLCLLAVLTLFRLHRKNMSKHVDNKQGSDSLHLMESCNYYTLDNLKLNEAIGQGRYGCVWRGSVGEQQIAVKVFSPHHKNYFYNERDIYTLPFMDHSSLLSYYGCDERTNCDGNVEYMLLLSLAPNGTLVDYLRSNTIDWTVFCSMCLSLAKGVAHLHTDIKKGDKFKPCISHRDLNSRNVLVKDDLSCVVSDLGFATKINGSKYYYNGEEQHAETKSINDVGTLRYMSPEVLEGAVNLRDCETSLKQIDVYALGLILWEIASRCTDLFPNGVDSPPYKMPFEAEIGHHPTFEQMQVLVCKHKARPLFPDLWRDTPAVRTIKETIEDCWDQDAEARLTALCVEERFHELSGVSDRHKRPVGCNMGISPSVIQKDSHNVFAVNVTCTGDGDKTVDSCVSESTVETLLTTSPTNPQIACKNSNQYQGYNTSIQPYQGRNPCLERNLMSASDDGQNKQQELIDKSLKHQPAAAVAATNLSGETSTLVTDYLATMLQHQTNAQYTNSSEPLMRGNTPIPYVQNVVYSDSLLPKHTNLNQNQNGNRNEKKHWSKFRKFVDFFKPDDNLVDKTNLLTPNTPEDKIDTLVDLKNGRAETKLTKTTIELGKQNNKRPNSLPLKSKEQITRNNIEKFKEDTNLDKLGEVYSNDVFKSDIKLKDPSSRVKTPGDLPLAIRKNRVKKNATRFSLYDDRIMSGVYDNDVLLQYQGHGNHNNNGHVSGDKYDFVFNSFEEMNFTQNV